MKNIKDFIMKKKMGAFLISESRAGKTKEEYIENAEPGLIVAFKIVFETTSLKVMSKVISGKILSNDKEAEEYRVETRNGLIYGVPYNSVVWVKTGARWPRGVYDEMRKGSVEVDDQFLPFDKNEEIDEVKWDE